MSIPLLKDELDHLHTALDDVESFVYVLWYHVLRYCALPIVSDSLEDDLNTVFTNLRAGTDTRRATGGDGKLAFFHNIYFPANIIASSRLPRVLVRLLEALRSLFKAYYAQPPEKPTFDKEVVEVEVGEGRSYDEDEEDDEAIFQEPAVAEPTDTDLEAYESELFKWQLKREKASAKLRAPHVIVKEIFDIFLTGENSRLWAKADSAVDNIVAIVKATSRPATRISKASARSSRLGASSATSGVSAGSKRPRDGDSQRSAMSAASSKVPRRSESQRTPRSRGQSGA
jgi:hypothetical protein